TRLEDGAKCRVGLSVAALELERLPDASLRLGGLAGGQLFQGELPHQRRARRRNRQRAGKDISCFAMTAGRAGPASALGQELHLPHAKQLETRPLCLPGRIDRDDPLERRDGRIEVLNRNLRGDQSPQRRKVSGITSQGRRESCDRGTILPLRDCNEAQSRLRRVERRLALQHLGVCGGCRPKIVGLQLLPRLQVPLPQRRRDREPRRNIRSRQVRKRHARTCPGRRGGTGPRNEAEACYGEVSAHHAGTLARWKRESRRRGTSASTVTRSSTVM